MSNLLTLKREAKSAKSAWEKRKRRRFELRTIVPVMLLAAGPVCIPNAIRYAEQQDQFGFVFWTAVSVLTFGTILAMICWRGDKKETALKEANDTAVNAYMNALWTEAASCGIDITSTITQRTEPLSDSYEITALRNGNPVDVVAREYDGEIVFMLNGERMKPGSSIASTAASARKWFGR